VLGNRSRFIRPSRKISGMFSPDATAAKYESLFEEIAHKDR
jgi:hypothetical protein